MIFSWLTSMFSADKAKAAAISSPTLNVTKIVLFSVAMFAIITQILAATGAVTLSATQQFTTWLVAAVLIVLLSIADMTCRTYATAKKYEFSAAVQERRRPPVEQDEQRPQEPESPVEPKVVNLGNGKGAGLFPNQTELCPPHHATPPRNGTRLTVKMEDVFPHGCRLEPDSIAEAQDYDETTEIRPLVDKLTGHLVYQCRVVDQCQGPESEGQSPETVVKIVAAQMPDPPTRARFELVEFEGLTAVPCAIGPGRVVYSSLRATGFRSAPAADQVS